MRLTLQFYICFWAVLYGAVQASASVVMPDDGPYRRYHQGSTQYIFTEDNREVIGPLMSYHQVFRRMYDKSYGWHLDEDQDLILTSPRQQIGNAFATIIPNVKSVWFPSGGEFLDASGTSSWLLTLDAHETAHLYQLNAKGGFNGLIKPVFGSSLFTTFFIIPIFIHPNLFTPTFLVEGNAVLQESRINQGGRLHSGEVRALVVAQIKDGDIDPTRLINDEFKFPFGQEAYIQGGYFQAHLAAKHGLDKTNSFFVAQGERYFWPLLLNKTFRHHFGASYPQEIREYVRSMEGMAAKQRTASTAPLFKNVFISPLNHDAEKVWCLATDGVEPPVLHEYSKKDRVVIKKQLQLPLGKVFFDGTKPLAVDSDQNDLHHITYSLYGEGRQLNPRFKGQIVTDQRAGKTVALDAKHGWLETQLLVDGVPYDISHSSPMLSPNGDIYYFRQNGAERILYRNREPVFKMEGFYGKLAEIAADGTVYFIGNTDYGSTLYRFQEGEISRLLPSDRVVDARQISEKEFLVKEIGSRGHSVHVETIAPRAAAPAVYTYGFPSENVVPDATVPTDQIRVDERPYNSLLSLRYGGLEILGGYSSSSGGGFGFQSILSDPLQYNTLALGYFGSEFQDKEALIAYEFSKYLVNWFADYRYEEEWWRRRDGGEQRSYNHEASLGITIPLLRHRNWDSLAGLALSYEREDLRNDPTSPTASLLFPNDTEDTYGLKSQFGLRYEVPTQLGMYPWRAFNFSLYNRLDTLENEWTKKHNTSVAQISYHHGFPQQFYAQVFGHVGWAENRDIDVDYSDSPNPGGLTVPLLTARFNYEVKHVQSLRLEVHKVLDMNSYSARIPIGLDRLAPFIAGQGIAFDRDRNNDYPANNFEWGYGADLQIRLLHRIPALVRVMNAYNTRYPETEEASLQLKITSDF